MTESSDKVETRRGMILLAAFSAWMFAGLENALFIVIHRQMMLTLLGPEASEKIISAWFAWFQAAFLFGAAAGGWLFGWLGDRMGRSRAMGWSVACYSGMTLLGYFVRDPELMWTIRCLACLGFGGCWPNAVALVSEAWPSASRPLMAGILGAAANCGMVLMGGVAWFFAVTNDDWRWALLVGASPLLLAVWILLSVPESAGFLREKRIGSVASSGKSSVREVFEQPLLGRTLLGICLGAIPVVGTAANANWVVPWTDRFESRAAESRVATVEAATDSPVVISAGDAEPAKPQKADPRKKALTLMQRSGGAIFGSLLGGIVASFAGRRLTYFLISLCTFVVSTVIFTQLNPGHPLFPWMTILLGFFGVTYFGWLPLFLPELFPTRVRSTGTGISFNTGRVIAACIVLLIAFRIDSFQGEYSHVGFWTGMIYVVGMFVIWLAPKQPAEMSEPER